MAKRKTVSEQLRAAIQSADVSRYRMAKDLGLTQALLSRFIHRVGGLSMETIDKICEYLGLRLTAGDKPKQAKKPKGK